MRRKPSQVFLDESEQDTVIDEIERNYATSRKTYRRILGIIALLTSLVFSFRRASWMGMSSLCAIGYNTLYADSSTIATLNTLLILIIALSSRTAMDAIPALLMVIYWTLKLNDSTTARGITELKRKKYGLKGA